VSALTVIFNLNSNKEIKNIHNSPGSTPVLVVNVPLAETK
jgi:hypothetical protein